MGEITVGDYYEYRKRVRDLYDSKAANIGDLCSDILQIRDKNKCVSSIKVNIPEYAIDLEFDQDTPENKKINIKEKVANSISKYIENNKAELSNVDNDSFDSFIKADSHLFCDIIMVGDSLKFNL